jgi:hypothetical protein
LVEIEDGGRRHLEKSKIHQNCRIYRPIMFIFHHWDCIRSDGAYATLKIKLVKIQDGTD